MSEIPFDPTDPLGRFNRKKPPSTESRIEGKLAKKNERAPKFPDEWDDASQEKFMSGTMTIKELENFLPKFSFLDRDMGEIWRFDSIFIPSRGGKDGAPLLKIRNQKGMPLNKNLYNFVNDLTSGHREDMAAKLIDPNAKLSKPFSLLGLYEPLKK